GGRPADRAADEIPSADQPSRSERDRSRDPPGAARSRGRAHPVNEVASGPQAGLTRVDSAFAAPTVRAAHRGRLFRRYLLLILTLVTIALLASGAISLYFTYQETKASLASLQHEKAVSAASRIEQYVDQVAQQLAFAALPQLDPNDVE